MKLLQDRLEPAAADAGESPKGRRLLLLSLTALGVVYGDIGTSPLYAIRACFYGDYAVPANAGNILGVLSMIFWSLLLVISIKYLAYVMRADNRGEGGILALMALVHPSDHARGPKRRSLVALGLFGAGLLYGDGTITPAISVLSSIEGLEVATPVFEPYVVPITVLILILFFSFQRRGTGRVGAVFGPIMMVWFAVIAMLGLNGIIRRPGVLMAVDPMCAVEFFRANGWHGFAILGAVFLVVTGGEALYADMGHFGKKPVRTAWFGLVLPALLMNYFGQGALLLNSPHAVKNPFYLLAPSWALYPLVLISTVATVIASQAVVSGAFSLTRQAVQLGYSPRTRIEHTSQEEIGQVYIPGINWVLMVLTIALVIGFRQSTNLAAAYGVAVSTTMVITTLLAFCVARELWKWSRPLAGAVTAFFLIPDLGFFFANLAKVGHGGWFPLLMGSLVYTLMSTWRTGRLLVRDHLLERRIPIEKYLDSLLKNALHRVRGTAVFLTGSVHGTPPALLYQLEHNKVLHEKVVFLTVMTRNVPYVPVRERVQVEEMAPSFYRVIASYGFMQDPNVPAIFRLCKGAGLDVEMADASFFLGRETVIASKHLGMSTWRAKVFAVMFRNALRASAFFHIPHDRVIELGVEVEI